MRWSPELRVMCRPTAAYRALWDAPSGPSLAGRLGRLAVVLGGVGSLTTAGRLVPLHLVAIPLAWAFVPVLQALVVVLVARWGRLAGAPSRLVSMHLAGNGPYLALLLGLAGMCLVAPDVGSAVSWGLTRGLLPGAVVAAALWGKALSFACWRAVSGGSTRRALGLVGREALLQGLLVLGWYLAIDNIAPQFLGVAR